MGQTGRSFFFSSTYKSVNQHFPIFFQLNFSSVIVIILFMIELTSKQRKFLEKSAQPMSPMVLIGGAGVTVEQIKQIQTVIKTHELIKVKFNEFKDEKQELAKEIEEQTASTLVRIIGNVAVFYKEAEKPADRKYAKGLLKA